MAHIRESRPDSGLGFQENFLDRLRVGWLNGWEGYHESRRCSKDTYPESYITKYTRYTGSNACDAVGYACVVALPLVAVLLEDIVVQRPPRPCPPGNETPHCYSS